MPTDESSVLQVLGRFPAEFAPLDVSRPESSGFSGALIARIRCRAGAFCLRGWPPGALPPERIFGLHRLLREVYDRGVSQVAVPVPARDGRTLVRFGDRLWQFEPWMPGRADFHARPTPQRLAAAMTCLAQWHRAAAEFRCSDPERPWFEAHSDGVSPGVAERLRKVERWLGVRGSRLWRAMGEAPPSPFAELGGRIRECFHRAAPRIVEELRGVAGLRVPLQPCLRDVWHDHLLFTEDEVTGLIDPSACRTESVAADLARLLGSLLGDDPAAWQSALDFYETLRPLSDAETRLMAVLDRAAVPASGMNWLDRRYLRGWDCERDPRVLERMRTILGRLERLAG